MAKNTSLFSAVIGKVESGGIASGGKYLLTHTVPHVGSNIHAMGVGIGVSAATLGNMLMLGGFGVVSAISNQLEYISERKEIANFYREELAAKAHKQQNKVGDNDLSAAEFTNGTIKEAVGHERSVRNLGIGASFVASIGVYALMELAMPGGSIFAKIALGALSYLAMKSPIMAVGKQLFGLNKETTHDLITDIAKDRSNGKVITREQVVEVFLSGNKQLQSYVESSFDAKYDDLPLADKVKVSEEVALLLPIDKIVQNINNGTSNASELAYTVQGDFSGVLPKEKEERELPPSMFARFAEKCKSMAAGIGGMFSREKAETVDAVKSINKAQKEQEELAVPNGESPIVELNHEKSHVERHGLSGKDKTQGHVAQEVSRRAQNVTMPETSIVH